jgi:hypothetical protein
LRLELCLSYYTFDDKKILLNYMQTVQRKTSNGLDVINQNGGVVMANGKVFGLSHHQTDRAFKEAQTMPTIPCDTIPIKELNKSTVFIYGDRESYGTPYLVNLFETP